MSLPTHLNRVENDRRAFEEWKWHDFDPSQGDKELCICNAAEEVVCDDCKGTFPKRDTVWGRETYYMCENCWEKLQAEIRCKHLKVGSIAPRYTAECDPLRMNWYVSGITRRVMTEEDDWHVNLLQ
ncbi:hypothetical protein SPFM15_00180 [Salmonella phage SPFM15]|nr:hypothetical protein SPFM5_00175 [Salmonella phage SPFM5]VFR13804.1 hypothetical protein SPFM15_00180 [Salmonella phage SPFM15]